MDQILLNALHIILVKVVK